MEPLFEHRMEFAGYETRVLELEGRGDPIVLLHGWSDSADTWRCVLAQLGRQERRAIAVDLPGFGAADPLAGRPDAAAARRVRRRRARLRGRRREARRAAQSGARDRRRQLARRLRRAAPRGARAAAGRARRRARPRGPRHGALARADRARPRAARARARAGPVARARRAERGRARVPLARVRRPARGRAGRSCAPSRSTIRTAPRSCACSPPAAGCCPSCTTRSTSTRSAAGCSSCGATATGSSSTAARSACWPPSPGSRLELLERCGHSPQHRAPGARRRAAARRRRAARPGRLTPAARPSGQPAGAARARLSQSPVPMDLVPTPEQLGAAAANVFDRVMRGGLADLRPLPTAIVDEGPQRTVRRYLSRRRRARLSANGHAGRPAPPPVLLVPPLAAPASCFDLRRGCSLAEHLLARRPPAVRRRLRADRVRRPQPRPRALGRRGHPARDRGGLGRRRRRRRGAARRLVPRRDHVAARGGRRTPSRSARSPSSRARST